MSYYIIDDNYFSTTFYAELIFQDAEFDPNKLSPLFGANLLFKRVTVMRMQEGIDQIDYLIPLTIFEVASIQLLDIVEVSYNNTYSTWKIVVEFVEATDIKEFMDEIQFKLNNLFSRIQVNYYVRGLMFEESSKFINIWRNLEELDLERMIDLCDEEAKKEEERAVAKYFYTVSIFLSYASDLNASCVDYTETAILDADISVSFFSILLEFENSPDIIKFAQNLLQENDKPQGPNMHQA